MSRRKASEIIDNLSISDDSEVDAPAEPVSSDDDEEFILPPLFDETPAKILPKIRPNQGIESEASDSEYSDGPQFNEDDLDDVPYSESDAEVDDSEADVKNVSDDFLLGENVVDIGEANISMPNERFINQSFQGGDYVWTDDIPNQKFPEFRRYSSTFGPTDVSKFDKDNITSPLAYWELFLDKKIIDRIVTFTNKYGRHIRKNKWRDTSPTEIRGFIGLCYMLGIESKTSMSNVNIFSSLPGLGSHFAPLTFSRIRFQTLLQVLRFDDAVARKEKPKEGRYPLEPVSDLFYGFTQNCRMVYIPGKNVTIDESMAGFRGHCKFRMYLPAKPCKYGLKIWCVNDAKNFYLFDAQIYCGKVDENDAPEKKLGEKVVMDLTTGLRKAGRIVTCDNFFTSAPLADKLYDESTYIVSTIRKNRKEIPDEFCMGKIPEKTSEFLFSDHRTLVRYQGKPNKAVYLLSTRHHHPQISNGGDGKPTIVLDYNKSKGGVDAFDMMVTKYSTKLRNSHWPMRVFFWILDAAALNAYRIYQIRNFENIGENIQGTSRQVKNVQDTRLKFLCVLSYLLMRPQQTVRSQSNHWYAKNIQKINELRDEIAEKFKKGPKAPKEAPKFNDFEDNSITRTRCVPCGKKGDRKTRICCRKCRKPVCGDHSVIYCHDCCD